MGGDLSPSEDVRVTPKRYVNKNTAAIIKFIQRDNHTDVDA
jgi:hypothetical protein